MRLGVSPVNLHEFTKDIVEYYEQSSFDVIAELGRVRETLKSFSEHSPDQSDKLAYPLDDVVISLLIQQFDKIKQQSDKQSTQTKPKEKEAK